MVTATPRIPLKALIVDADPSSAGLLLDSLRVLPNQVLSADHVTSLTDAHRLLMEHEINTIFEPPRILRSLRHVSPATMAGVSRV